MLKAINLTHSFDYPLFENISLELASRESIAILGISGSGKSTLLHILSSFLSPKSGEVWIDDQNIYNLKNAELENLRREKLALIFQQHYLFRGFSALDNLTVSSLLSDQMVDWELLEKLQIKDVIKQNSADLSGGQQQRVSIARVLIKKPKIIFADEPTGNLDSATAKVAMDTIFDYLESNNAGLVIATHDENLAFRASKCYRLIGGELVQVK